MNESSIIFENSLTVMNRTVFTLPVTFGDLIWTGIKSGLSIIFEIESDDPLGGITFALVTSNGTDLYIQGFFPIPAEGNIERQFKLDFTNYHGYIMPVMLIDSGTGIIIKSARVCDSNLWNSESLINSTRHI
jgi:hypothetical protein